jgi:hypothetical protein
MMIDRMLTNRSRRSHGRRRRLTTVWIPGPRRRMTPQLEPESAGSAMRLLDARHDDVCGKQGLHTS